MTPLPPTSVPSSTVCPADVSFKPDNPREEIGDVSDLVVSLSEVGQIVAITVAAKDAYLKSRPERQSDLEHGAKYVDVDGSRRLKAAREAALPTSKVMLGDEFSSTDENRLEAAFIANATRKDLSELEEAQALQRLVTSYGSQHQAAKRLGMSQPLIKQKLSLLALTPDLQADLEVGRCNVSHVRNMTKVPAEQQRHQADRHAAADTERTKQRVSKRSAPDPAGDSSVITPQAPAPVQADTPGLPWKNPQTSNRILRDHMTEGDRLTLAKLLSQ
ncbi:ParB/RepB/Spo0J family partition protein [Streptomyces sp. NPDC002701]|uniref:ParB/RepB/Spo0J family partition protein n=1 Tax=Streptomyces sp. NPDC002701 TaxID=3364661 RepID=UPI0036B96022